MNKNEEVSVDYEDVVAFVDAADNLAESITNDMVNKRGRHLVMSVNTINFWRRYKMVASKMQNVIDFINRTKQTEQ